MPFFASPYATVTLVAIAVIYTLWALGRGRADRPVLLSLGVGLAGWLLIVHGLLAREMAFPADIGGASFLAIVFAAVGAAGALLLGIGPMRRLLLALPQDQLLLLQGVRVWAGALFLAHAAIGVLPLTFGILDGMTHVSAGLFALVAAWCWRSGSDGRRRAVFAHVFGLADILVVASTIAFVLLPVVGPHHPIMHAVFVVAPLWFWFHLLGLRDLWRSRRQAAA